MTSMPSETELAIVRKAFARQVMHAARVVDPRLETAFATVPREDFLGDGPWHVMRLMEGSHETPDADPVFLYQDQPIAIRTDLRLNNGQPSFLAMLIGSCAVCAGDKVVHIGAGTGYYTALLSHLAGPSGHVLGLEHEPDLARRATRNLEASANAEIVQGDGWTHPLAPADVILVNAGTPRPSDIWLDALKPGGRLVLPLAVSIEHLGRPMTRGGIFLVTRGADGYTAAWTSGTVIYPCWGGSEPEAEAALAAAFEAGGVDKVRRLRRGTLAGNVRVWVRGDGWALTYD